jgi:hypothetical protein
MSNYVSRFYSSSVWKIETVFFFLIFVITYVCLFVTNLLEQLPS